jgi:hypothetical protein
MGDMENSFVNKLSLDYQKRWADKHKQFFDRSVLNDIDLDHVTLHSEVDNPMSSQASCLNVMGYLNRYPDNIKSFFSNFSINITNVIDFPTGVNVGGEIYNDKGPIIFEWIGPRRSPIHERSGGRGTLRTSIDAYLLATLDNKVTQLLIEWKFSENYNSEGYTHKFAGIQGNERLRRYSSVIATLRREQKMPFNLSSKLGLYDLAYEPYYQLLRMTLLAKMTMHLRLTEGLWIQDYKIIHLVHSANDSLKSLNIGNVKYSPGLRRFVGRGIHDIWKNEILTHAESQHFVFGYWNKVIPHLSESEYKNYLVERYG